MLMRIQFSEGTWVQKLLIIADIILAAIGFAFGVAMSLAFLAMASAGSIPTPWHVFVVSVIINLAIITIPPILLCLMGVFVLKGSRLALAINLIFFELIIIFFIMPAWVKVMILKAILCPTC